MTKYKIVLLPFPFDDLSSSKVRPAVCLTDPIGRHRHVVVAFITSQSPSDPVPSDVALDSSDADFAETGLKVTSALRLHRVMTAPTRLFIRELGDLSASQRAEVTGKLRHLFQL